MGYNVKHSDLQYLAVGLPEDIQKLKWGGDFERAERVIQMRLQKELPEALRARLELERWILKRLPAEYVYTQEQAFEEFDKTFQGAAREELEQLQDEGAIEWIFVKGQVRYKDDFVENLLKTRKELWSRLKDPSRVEGRIQGALLLDRTVREMKEKGGLAYRMHIRACLRVEEEAKRPGALIRVHLPLPVETEQARTVKVLKTSLEPAFTAPPNHPQRTLFMETRLEPGQEFWVEYVLESHAGYVGVGEDGARGCLGKGKVHPGGDAFCRPGEGERDGKSLAPYLEEQPPHIRFTPYLRALTAQVVEGETDPLKRARRIYDYITTHVMYSFVRQYATIDNLPEYMAAGLKGDCGIYALLFITMCRIAKVPAKWQSGLYATPLDISSHDWAQFYIESLGWLYADCSFGGAAWRDAKKERWNFYFGNVDPFRIPLCSQFQQEFAPPRSFLREDPYDNQSGEMEYEDRGLISGLEYRSVRQVVEIEGIPFER